MNHKKILTMNDFDFNGKTVIVRVDINCPIDPETGEFLDKRRIVNHAKTIKDLIQFEANVVLMSHQGRPGAEYGFTTLEKHTAELSDILDFRIEYVPDIMGPTAKEKIQNLRGGAILLENTRFLSEEMLNRPADAQANTHFVKHLAPLADAFVFDAFATAHRSQPSLIGFTEVLPSVAGRVMENEIKVLDQTIGSGREPKVFVAGGAKVNTSFKVIRNLIDKNVVEKVLTCGLVANLFLRAKGYDVRGLEYMRDYNNLVNDAKDLLHEHEEIIELPNDIALDKYGTRMEADVSELPFPYRIADIGSKTIEHYKEIIATAGTIIANGPAGIFEQREFSKGTDEIVTAMSESSAFSLVGGGHIASSVTKLGLEGKIGHVSTGGKACISYIAGDPLPTIEALKASAKRYKEKGE